MPRSTTPRRAAFPKTSSTESRLIAEEEAVEGEDTVRLCAFSDGVFAIVITLLILEIKVPTPHDVPADSILTVFIALAKQWPMYVAYLLGFVTVGIMWNNHLTLFRYIVRTDHMLKVWNTLLLLVISLAPFVTALLSEYLPESVAHQKAAVLVYCGNSFLMALFFNRLWRHAERPPRTLLDRTKDPRLFDLVTHRYQFGPAIYLATFFLTFVSVPLTLSVVGLLALLFALPYDPRDPAALPFLRQKYNRARKP